MRKTILNIQKTGRYRTTEINRKNYFGNYFGNRTKKLILRLDSSVDFPSERRCLPKDLPNISVSRKRPWDYRKRNSLREFFSVAVAVWFGGVEKDDKLLCGAVFLEQ